MSRPIRIEFPDALYHVTARGHMANRLGFIAAHEITARAKGVVPEKLLPERACYVFSSLDPMELIRIDSRYKFRGDGLIAQTVKQFRDPNPRGEDVQWARTMFEEFLALKA